MRPTDLSPTELAAICRRRLADYDTLPRVVREAIQQSNWGLSVADYDHIHFMLINGQPPSVVVKWIIRNDREGTKRLRNQGKIPAYEYAPTGSGAVD